MQITGPDQVTRDHVPFVIGRPGFTRAWAERSPLPETVFLDVLDEEQLTLFRLLDEIEVPAPAVLEAILRTGRRPEAESP